MGEDYDKTISILAYIPFVGWIIALILNSDKQVGEKAYNAYHLRQGLGLFIAYLLYSILNWLVTWIPGIGYLIDSIIVISFVLIALLGITNAYRGYKKPLPFFGETINKILTGAFE
jgi:uncharacterized membrane protein